MKQFLFGIDQNRTKITPKSVSGTPYVVKKRIWYALRGQKACFVQNWKYREQFDWFGVLREERSPITQKSALLTLVH